MKLSHIIAIILGIILIVGIIQYRQYRRYNWWKYYLKGILKEYKKGKLKEDEPKDYSKPMQITSRYIDTLKEQNITINPNNIPENLRDLLPLAEKWAIGDDEERDYFVHTVSEEEKREFIDKVWPRMDEIERWCSSLRDTIPEADEVILFDWMAEAAAEVHHGIKEENRITTQSNGLFPPQNSVGKSR